MTQTALTSDQALVLELLVYRFEDRTVGACKAAYFPTHKYRDLRDQLIALGLAVRVPSSGMA